MRITPIVVVAFAAALAATTSAGAATITGLYNTGVNSSGAPLPDGTVGDPHYSLVSVPVGSTSATLVRTSAGGFPIPPYLGDDSVSAWIGPNNDSQLDGPGGRYDYQITFNVVGPSTASIFGQWSSDNAGDEIDLNGVNTFNPGNPYGTDPAYSFTRWVPFSISGLVSGTYTLDFIVMNGNGGSDTSGPTALRVEFTPLPSTWTMLIAGFIALGFIAYRGKKRGSGGARTLQSAF
jgi:hypothetical protein